ncbi:Protein phosphatase 1 regulatory subunit 37 [Aix galericulata]|nr:Protein phosphatase 1 regulatory subunit 37 [Aix galericulata]
MGKPTQNVTVDEIVSAYKQACQKLNCKQIPKLLKQIQEFKDLAPRIDCLDLKGEKLDYKACEALEEIFKRVQFKIVDLEQTSLDEDRLLLQTQSFQHSGCKTQGNG